MGRMNGQRLLVWPARREVMSAPMNPTTQTETVMACARREVHPGWERMVGLNADREPADTSAQKKRSVLFTC